MSTTRIDPNKLDDNESLDQAKQIGAMAAAFGEVMSLGPDVLSLQRALLAGMGYSQEREVKRLAATLDKEDPRLVAALDRARVFRELADGGEAVLSEATRVVGNAVTQPGLQGYVSRADGSPAVRHFVQLALPSNLNEGKLLEAETDERGYFNIVLGRAAVANLKRSAAAAQPPAAPATTGATAASSAPAATASDAAASTAAASSDSSSTSNAAVRVLDDKRNEVFRDPLPPNFSDGEQVWFRYYVIGMDRAGDVS